MSSPQFNQFKPFVSICIIISFFFLLVFLKMEERRMSYVLLKSNKENKKIVAIKKQKEIQLAKLTRPQLVETVAKSQLTLKRATQSQIIHLNPSVSLSYLNNHKNTLE